MNRLARFVLQLFILVLYASAAPASEPAQTQDGSSLRYTFSWPLSDASALQPRGGTSRGAPVQIDRSVSPEWQALQAPGLSIKEKDRRAIFAMAGTYRVSFDFLEVVPFTELSKPNAPYQSWGTERVYVDTNEAEFISLVHILQMQIVQDDGSLSEPMVTKHWRQDWRYEPKRIVEFVGRDQWQQRPLSAKERSGQWSQTVYQVDESPRYASIGRWQHSNTFSTWLSADTWRPLPRREWSVRKDYQALIGTNRHTITPTGWLQEENNLKAVLTPQRKLDPTTAFVAREYGVARYERIRDMSFNEADQYYQKTRGFWDQVRDAWTETFNAHSTVTLRGPVDQLGLYKPLFERADAIANGARGDTNDAMVIHAALRDMGVPE